MTPAPDVAPGPDLDPDPAAPVTPGPWDGRPSLWLLRTPGRGEPQPALDDSALDADERARAAAFVRNSDRGLYLAAHISLRRLLGACLATSPGNLRFTREPCPQCGGPHGRPALPGPHPPLHFSLSHCEGLVLIGVAGSPVGVDAERVPDPGTVGDLVKVLHPAERADLAALPAEARAAAFCRVWSRKEAYLKGVGVGLGRALDADYVGDRPRHDAVHPSGWSLRSLDLGPLRGTHAAAVALRDTAPPVLRILPDAYPHPPQQARRT
ncbi:4'-phosphopantetheinyl transferase superfamily protein [Streptomyces sp. NBC_00056]|uniref:4'-phosphopantetheinyl transferase family protein n=1 Tax=unclassified Streptomyces TaxID=2593676 RepID=UPI0022525DA4|nr:MULTISPECIES: 4'-phosphopantetheinyl transferase superfamily protein [unclassified Streptomyces]MCX5442020.1 4'-phosphopantetheinyl transferase superfamily protein [Streptomyces sp. NBC_00063]WUB91733.1 4'-phosphopantetheinyl transferase superfamily protein [Streptomyces sp. NBC_00569]